MLTTTCRFKKYGVKPLTFILLLVLVIWHSPLPAEAEDLLPNPENPHQIHPAQEAPPAGIIGLALHISARRVGDPAGLYIRAVHPEGPAGKAGLFHGEEIIAVDGESLIGKTYQQVVMRIRGEVGKPVVLKVDGNQGMREVTVERIHESKLMTKRKTKR